MATVRDFAITIFAAAVSSMVCEMPAHEAGDLLVAFVNKDTNTNFTTPSGWTALQTQVSAGAGGGVYAKRAAISSEAVTFALALETCCAVVLSVKGANGTTVADAISVSAKSAADDLTLPLTGSGVTPLHNNCLLLHGLSADSGLGPIALPPWINIFAGDTGFNSLCVAMTAQRTAAAVVAPDHWAGLADDVRGFIIAIRDDGVSGEFPAYMPLSAPAPTQITPLNGTAGVVDKGTYRASNGLLITSVAGKTVTGVAAASTADSGINPFRGSMRNIGASSTTALNHVELPLTAPVNLTEKAGLIFGTYLNAAPRDYVDTGKAIQGGKYIVVGSTTANWRAWVVGGQFSKTERPDARNNYLIEVGSASTIYGSAGAANMASAQEFAFGSSGYYGAPIVLWNELYLLSELTLAGGSAAVPFDFDDIIFTVNNGCGMLPLMQQAGAGATCWAPIKFGSVDAVHVKCNLNTFQYPRAADEIDYVDAHVSANTLGFVFDGRDRGAGDVDTFAFTNCLFTSPSPYRWEFAATHAAAALVNMSGTSVVGASVALRATSPLSGMAFINCPSFIQNGAALSDIEFINTSTTISNPAALSNSSFASGGVGHAITITVPGTYTFAANQFTGYGPGGTTDAAVYNNSGGAVTLNITGGGGTPTVRNGVGATTTVNNAVTIELTGLVSGSRIYIRNTTDGVDLFNQIEATTAFMQSVNFAGNKNLTVRVRNASGSPIYKPYETNGMLTSAGFSAVVNQVVDQ